MIALRLEPDLVVETPAYTLTVADGVRRLVERPFADLASPSADGSDLGTRWSRLCLLASAHTGASADETWRIVDATVARDDSPAHDSPVRITLTQSSTAWTRKIVQLRCTADAVELTVTVEGTGDLHRVTLLGGDGSLPTGAAGRFRSSIDVPSLAVPAPTEPVAFVRSAHLPAQLGVVGDADPGRLNGIFSPPPFVFALGRGDVRDALTAAPGETLGVSVRAAVQECGFTTLGWEPLDGGALIAFDFEGHTRVTGSWTSPALVLRPAASAADAIADHRADLIAHGYAPDDQPVAARPGWWREPLFCGWGAQCAMAAGATAAGTAAAGAAVPGATAAGAASAGVSPAALSRADTYDAWLARLDAHGVNPGTVVIDDRWESVYGSGVADPDQWPDPRGWIAAQHARGRRVLLWWKAWDPSAAPPEECVTSPDGRPLAVDPGSPAYRARLAATIRHLLSPEGLGADGLKVDFTQRAPSGRTLQRARDAHPGDGTWGVAALHAMLRTIYTAAKEAKPDALVITHAAHPSFGDCADMIRTNDVLERDLDGRPVPVAEQLRARAGIVARSLPGHLIDTDQWPMPDLAQWREYAETQVRLGVPALYYADAIDNSREPIEAHDLARIADLWARYRSDEGLS